MTIDVQTNVIEDNIFGADCASCGNRAPRHVVNVFHNTCGLTIELEVPMCDDCLDDFYGGLQMAVETIETFKRTQP